MRPRRRLSATQAMERQCFLWAQRRASGREDAPADGATRAGGWFGCYVTLSREFGCGALWVADELVERLGWTVYDSHFLDQLVADAEASRLLRESLGPTARRWLEAYLDSLPAAQAPAGAVDFRRLVRAIAAVAHHGNAIFIGRGTHLLLPASRGVRVKLIAPLEDRVRWIAGRQGLLAEEAHQLVSRTDSARADYLRRNFGAGAGSDQDFDRVFDMSRVSTGEVADAIAEMAVLKLGVRPAIARDHDHAADGRAYPGATFDPSAMAW